MSNHPNRSRLPCRVQAKGRTVAAFASYVDAMRYAQERSRRDGLVEVADRTGLVGQYNRGNSTQEFADRHRAIGGTV